MGKKKRQKGGGKVKMNEVIYDNILNYHLKQIDLPSAYPNLKHRAEFIKKCTRFVLHDDGADGEWPLGKTLHIKIYVSDALESEMLFHKRSYWYLIGERKPL